MLTCPQCEHSNPAEAVYCNQCGTKLNENNRLRTLPQTKAERRQLTVLFCDLVDSTALSERLDPEEYREVILSYQRVVENIIKQYGGTVGNYLGDGLLIYFGYPIGLENAPIACLRAGLEIIRALKKANKEWKEKEKSEVQVRIGINTGLAVVDNRMALGDTLNIASRLEGLSSPNHIVVSESTKRLVEGWFEFSSKGIQTIKGISRPMEVFEVLRETGARTRLDIGKFKGLSPLIGRHKEIRILQDLMDKSIKGKGHIALISGEAGIGKSRIIDRIKELAEQKNRMDILEVRSSHYFQNSAFYPIIELLQNELLKFDPTDDSEEKLYKLEKFLLHVDVDFAESMRLFAEFLHIASARFTPLIQSPFAKRQRIFEGLQQTIIDRAKNKPLLLVFEDLHWADPSTLEWLDFIRSHLNGKSILILTTSRPEYRPDWISDNHDTYIQLGRLSHESIIQMCQHQSGGKILPDEILSQISEKTEGVPLFVEELTKMIMESDYVIEKETEFELRKESQNLDIPSTLKDSLLARLDQLRDGRDLVQMGSVLGRKFSPELLQAMSSIKVDVMEESIQKLLEVEIFQQLRVGDQYHYQFKHALIQETAYNSLLKSHRQQLHHRVANVIEHQFEDLATNHPEVLGHHYTEAGIHRKAVPIWLLAGQQAYQQNATSEAISHLEKGISLLKYLDDKDGKQDLELDLKLTLGSTYIVSHGFPHPKVKETFHQARVLSQESSVNPKLAMIYWGLLSFYINREEYSIVEEIMQNAWEHSNDPEHGYYFKLVGCTGSAYIQRGEFEKGVNAYQKIVETFDPDLPFPWEISPFGNPEVLAKSWLMIAKYALGNMNEARKLCDNHFKFAISHQDSMSLYHIHTFPAGFSLEAREWSTAQKYVEDYYPIVKKFGDPIFILTADIYKNIALGFQGDKDAFDSATAMVKSCYEFGFNAFAVSMSSWIGELYFQFDLYDEGLTWVNRVLDHVHQTGTNMHSAELYRIKGLLLEALKEPVSIVKVEYEKAIEIARRQKTKTYELRSTREYALLLHKEKKTKKAISLLESIYDLFKNEEPNTDLISSKKTLKYLKEM
jgi:class 3 adenylate cyclase/tetratricopeptide (TPR) repeat protein